MSRPDSTVGAHANPLSAAQQRQLVADRSLIDPPDHAVIGWHVDGILDLAALRSAVTALVARHPALRTRLSAQEAIPTQTVSAATDFELSEEGEALDEAAALPFDLVRGPLVRAVVSGRGESAKLSLVVPRIVCDHHSAGLLSAELPSLYGAALRGGPMAEPHGSPRAGAHPIPDDEQRDSQLTYWKHRLAGVPSGAELPTDLPRPSVHTQRCRTVFLAVPAGPVHRLTGQPPSDSGAFTVFGAVLSALLARYSRSRDVVFATQTAGARRPGDRGVVGCLSPLLPLRVDASDDPSLRDLLSRVEEAVRSASEHADVPYQRLVAELAPDREPSRHPLAQVALDVGPMSPAGEPEAPCPAGGGARPARGLRPRLVAPSRSPFDAAVTVTRSEDTYTIGLTCNADLFSADAADRVAGHFRRLLADGLAHPDRPLSTLDLLGPAEHEATVVSPNRTGPTPATTVLDLFARQVAARGDDTALWNHPQRHTYAELNARAKEWADHLADLGIRPDDRVALLLPHGPEHVIAMLAVLKAGGAYVPLDPAHPRERVDFVLRDSGARLLLTARQFSTTAPEGVERLYVDAPPPEPTGPRPRPDVTVSPDNLAYIMYTSGSTGVPKGVAVTHRCVVRLVCGLDTVDVRPDDTLLMLAPTAFDASTFEVWAALCKGARLAVHPPGPVGPRELGAELRRSGVTKLWLTAQLANLVADVCPEALEPLDTLVVGGEALSVPHLRALLRAAPRLRVVNGYGPTETTTFATTHPVTADQLDEATGIPIGRPLGGTRCYVVDGAGRPVPVGVPGELLVGGAGVARGYLGRPGLTAERFVPDPFGPPGGRLYRTGDLARRRADGAIEFLGRIDDQVKVRGFRIEPGEVRAVLVTHPAVRDAFVTVSGAGLAAQLTAYVVPASGDGADGAALRPYLRERLPEPLVPARFVPLDRLPLTANGKVDRRVLPDPLPARRGTAARGGEVPRSPWEKTVSDVWTAVIGRAPAHGGEDFFALGGTSLDLVRVAAEFAERYGTTVPLPTLLRLRTVEALAGALAAADVSASDRR